MADVQGVSGRDTGGHNRRVSRSYGGVSGGQRSEVRPGRPGTSESGTVQGVAEVLKPSDETEKRDPVGKQYSLTDTATRRRQYEVKRTQNANSETTVSESKADTTESKVDTTESEAAKPESAEAEVKTEAGDGDKAISMQDVIDKIREVYICQ